MKPPADGQRFRRLPVPGRAPAGMRAGGLSGRNGPAGDAQRRISLAPDGASDGTLAGLGRLAQSYSFLTPETESRLIREWHERDDKTALRDLIGSHLRLVIKIARGYRGYRMPMADLVAAGNIGLVQAARKFDPSRDVRFATYAAWWIRAAIQEHILHATSIVKMGTTAAQKKLFFNLRRLKAAAGWQGEADLPPELARSIAAELDVPVGEVIDMNRRLSRADSSLNTTAAGDGDREWMETIADERPDQETSMGETQELAQRRRLLGKAMAQLDAREREIVVERRLREAPPTLAELGTRFGVTPERIRQVEKRAVEKLEKIVRAAAQALERPASQAAA